MYTFAFSITIAFFKKYTFNLQYFNALTLFFDIITLKNTCVSTQGGTFMPLVSMKEMLIDAKENGYAVGQYNINNLEFTQAILEASQEENAPVILGVSEGAARYMSGFYTIVKMVEGLMHDLNITIPVAIHLDHGSSFEKCKEAIDAGFTSVMIDASHSPFEENVATTKKLLNTLMKKVFL